MPADASRNTVNDRYAKLTIGVCPDQWGVWFPQDERQIDWPIALDEMATAGFSVMETGPFGYFPTDPIRLKDEMDQRGFRVVAGTGWGVLHQEDAWPTTERLFRAIAQTHAEVGAEYIVHLPPMFRDEKTGAYIDDRTLSTQAWNLYISNADRLGRIMKQDYGLTMVLHPHGDSHIETPADIDRIFQATDPEYVGFCLDTGHIVYGASRTSTSRRWIPRSWPRHTPRTGPSSRRYTLAARWRHPRVSPRWSCSSRRWPTSTRSSM